MNFELTKELTDFSQGLQVLYVEDNEDVREATYELLEDVFGNVDMGIDGLDGLEKFKNNQYDLIITDINMPRLNGIELIKEIRELNINIPILVISAYSESGYFIETIKLGVEGYLLKPTEFEQFLQIISKTIEKIKLRTENEQYKINLENKNKSLIKDLNIKNDEILNIIYQDTLTILPNRKALDKDLKKLDGELLELFLIDINNFKHFNSLYGINTGDEILSKFALKLHEFANKNHYQAYRISADEFVIVSKANYFDLDVFQTKINNLLNTFDKYSIELDEIKENIDIYITVGVAIDLENLLSKASIALEDAKTKNKKVIIYNKDIALKNDVKNIFYWQKEIEEALKEDRIVPFFQPIFDQNKNILKYESLMRIKQYESNEVKYISPIFFLDISIQTRQYEALSMTMIKKVFEEMKKHRNKKFSINLGYRDIKSNSVKNTIKEFIQNTKTLNLSCKLIIEIVESEDIDDYKLVKDFFETLNCTQIEIAIDDFGSGYSNFNQILNIMPHYLKIDGSLIKNIATDPNSYSLVKAISSFARELNIKTIAEFVHNETVFEILKNEGINEFQGYFLGEPKETLL